MEGFLSGIPIFFIRLNVNVKSQKLRGMLQLPTRILAKGIKKTKIHHFQRYLLREKIEPHFQLSSLDYFFLDHECHKRIFTD